VIGWVGGGGGGDGGFIYVVVIDRRVSKSVGDWVVFGGVGVRGGSGGGSGCIG
jgi:hypothetical protein